MHGLWYFAAEDRPDFADPSFNDSTWKQISIPSNWFLGGLDHHGVVWFRTKFRFPQVKKYATLRFEGVDYFADVYLNGKPLGHHAGYFEAFAFDITDILHAGNNILAVRVESPYETPGLDGWHLRKRLIKGVLNHHDCRPGGGWEPVGQSYNTGGIWNRVYIEDHGAVTINQMLVRADLDTTPPTLYAQLTIFNRGPKKRSHLQLQCAPQNFEGIPQTGSFTMELPEGESVHSVEMPVNDVHLWQPWDRGFPHLYNVVASLEIGKETIHRSTQFGFRTVRVETGFRWFINGQPYFIRGSNYLPSQWLAETLYHEPSSSKVHPFGGGAGGNFFVRDVALAKKANLNTLRVHAHVLPCEFHEACDRAGMLIWQDFPFQWGYADDPEFHLEAKRQLRSMIFGLYNHPAIIAWCCHNESPCDAPWMANQAGGQFDPAHNRMLDEQMESEAHSLDPTRFVHRNSGTLDGHVYPGWYVGKLRDFQDLPGVPFVTEYGAQGLPEKQSLLRMLSSLGSDAGYTDLVRFKNWLDTHHKIPLFTKAMIKLGTSLWNLTERKHWKTLQGWMKGVGINIERSIYRNTPSIEKTPPEFLHARDVWETWRFHDFQPAETFDNGISPGNTLEQFINNSQVYQGQLIQFATECYRRAKYSQVTGIIQFDFCDPWPAVTWSVVDYWRTPKPSFEVLRRSMQPVLPCFQLPEKFNSGKAILVTSFVVNDLAQAFPAANCSWRLEGALGVIASANFNVDIPADSISQETNVTLTSMRPGNYKLWVTVASGQKILGENMYEISVL